MTKFEFVLNKFYEITVWSLFAAIAMTVLNGGDGMVPASILWQIPVLSFLGALSSLIYPWDRGMKRVCDSRATVYLIMNGVEFDKQLVWLVYSKSCRLLYLSVAIIFFVFQRLDERKSAKANRRLKSVMTRIDKSKNIVNHIIRLAVKSITNEINFYCVIDSDF